jgi:ABC-type cobalamin/Fe3+-siderophores transport system ATPase subunit
MIEIKKVEIDYKTIKMSFDNIIIKDNRVTVIEGKNGSGKTTLLRAMSGLIPFTGSIRLDGDITYIRRYMSLMKIGL